ncbi:putative membrane protein [Acinetobacter sp. 1294596]|nr:putative membrane protein [Acinetobacter sp. 1294596]EXF55541.1 putative membrane protein [Acinetobacter sp. 1294596]
MFEFAVFIITFITTIFIFLFLRFFYLQDQALDKTWQSKT